MSDSSSAESDKFTRANGFYWLAVARAAKSLLSRLPRGKTPDTPYKQVVETIPALRRRASTWLDLFTEPTRVFQITEQALLLDLAQKPPGDKLIYRLIKNDRAHEIPPGFEFSRPF
jgi:hypothetical protein